MANLPRTRQTIAIGLGLALLWSYWPVLGDVAARWSNDPKYSHGYLVPAFALVLLWMRLRRATPQASGQSSGGIGRATAFFFWLRQEWQNCRTNLESMSGSWWGLAVLLAGVSVHLAGAYIFIDWLSEVSLLLAIAGLVLCLGGWRLLRIAAPSIGFLAFMLPLPFQVETALGLPLRRLATLASTYLLEMLGICASVQGNIIVLNNQVLNVEDACSGLGMLVTFFALTVAVAIVLKRPWLDRIVVVASAVPVALIANIARITVTGILSETVGGPVANVFYHDWAGYLMMPFALALIWVELKVLSRLLVAPPAQDHTDIDLIPGMTSAPRVANKRRKVSVGK